MEEATVPYRASTSLSDIFDIDNADDSTVPLMRQAHSAPEPRNVHKIFDVIVEKQLNVPGNREVNILLGKHLVMDRDVVIKEVPRVSPRCSHLDPSPIFLEAMAEKEALVTLDPHPNIVKMYEYRETRDGLYMVLEHAQKGDMLEHVLSSIVRRPNGTFRMNLTELDIVEMFINITDALVFIHDRYLVHGDVKLDNIFLRQDGSAILGDFGKCKAYHPRIQSYDWKPGTLYYTCPEILDKKYPIFGPEMDIWGLGVSMYAAMCGTFPFDGNNDDKIATVLTSRPRVRFPPSRLISRRSQKIVRLMLEFDPGDRISAPDLLKKLTKRKMSISKKK